MRSIQIIAGVIIMSTLGAAGAGAHWEPPTEMFPWANPGAIRWMIAYKTMNESHVERLLGAEFNLLQGGAFNTESMKRAAEAGAHRMMYICSRTIYHEKLFPDHPELRDAAILTPDGEYKVIYNNPARYAGCFNRPAWLQYIKDRMDELQALGVDCIFFDNPMTWECYCPTCRAEFREYALEHTGTAWELGGEGTPRELERWFTLDSARDFFEQIHLYAHDREAPLFIVANNLSYWLIDQGVTDGVFTEAFRHPPFGRDIAACKIGLAASHGRPTGFLSYVPGEVRKARGTEVYHAPGATNMWVGLPIAEEYALGCATGLALGGNYMPNMNLNGDRYVLDLTKPEEDTAILAACEKYARFAGRWERLLADQQPGSGVGLLYDMTWGPRQGQILGLDRGNTNDVLWLLQAHGVPADVVVNSDLVDGGLAGFSALAIDGQAMLSPAEAEGLRAFVEGGGTLVLSASLSIRERYETTEDARPLAEFLPGVTDTARQEYSAVDMDLDGYELDGGRIKTMQTGMASVAYSGDAGLWKISVSYLDESDGQSTFELAINGTPAGTWLADADDDNWRRWTSEPTTLAEGDVISIKGTAGGGEYARLKSVSMLIGTDAAGATVVAIGAGRVVQILDPLEIAADDEMADAMEALRAAAPVTGDWPDTVLVNLLRQPHPGVLSAHILNYDYEYADDFTLTAVNPTPEITLQVADATMTNALLISPDAEPQQLSVVDGKVAVPAITNYAAVLLAADAASFAELTDD